MTLWTYLWSHYSEETVQHQPWSCDDGIIRLDILHRTGQKLGKLCSVWMWSMWRWIWTNATLYAPKIKGGTQYVRPRSRSMCHSWIHRCIQCLVIDVVDDRNGCSKIRQSPDGQCLWMPEPHLLLHSSNFLSYHCICIVNGSIKYRPFWFPF